MSDEHSEPESHLPIYNRIIVALAVMTGIEFGIAYMMTQEILGFVVGLLLLVGLAGWKAVLVARFFMHLRYDPRILAWIAVSPLVLGTPLVIICTYDAIHGASF